MTPLIQWFELGGTLKYEQDASTADLWEQFKNIQGLLETTRTLGIKPKDDPALLVSGAEFILEGLYALKKISRNEELGFYVERRTAEPIVEPGERLNRRQRPLN